MLDLEKLVEKVTNRMKIADGKVYAAYDSYGLLSARQLANWTTQRGVSGRDFGMALTVAMISLEAERQDRLENPPIPDGNWTRDAEWEELLAEAHRKLSDPDLPIPQAWKRTPLQALVGRESPVRGAEPRWHVSVAHENRIPTWEELTDAAHALRPGVGFVLGLPPRSWWMNYDDRVLHLWETNDEELIAHWCEQARGDRPT